MEIVDRVYNKVECTEPVILELLSCPSMLRLKGIDQAGYFEPYFPGYAHSRYEHSLGVFLLLKKFGAPIEEQVAGLIHDVSHTAFSHCIDYVFNTLSGEKQDFQDNVFERYVRKSEIPEIIKKHGLDIDDILHDENFPLKEKELPDLCADRIDYSLRTARVLNDYSEEFVDSTLSHLTTVEGNWVFDDVAHARAFSEMFRFVNTKYFSGIESAVMFYSVSEYLRYALEHGYIERKDIFLTDQEVLQKISQYHESDATLRVLFAQMQNAVPYHHDIHNYSRKVVCKARAVDPLVMLHGKMHRLSDRDLEWKEILQKEMQPKEYYLRFETRR